MMQLVSPVRTREITVTLYLTGQTPTDLFNQAL